MSPAEGNTAGGDRIGRQDASAPPGHPRWREGAAYDAMTTWDRRAFAWACLMRDDSFAATANQAVDLRAYVIRTDPLLLVVPEAATPEFASWGLHFRIFR